MTLFDNIEKEEGINVVSLFDGMACAMVALERAGIKVKNYYASEIDKYSMSIAKKNYPQIQHIGDITKLHHIDWTGIDLVCGGSPCQGFSFAGKQLNFYDPRSKLFFDFVRVLEEIKIVNPKVKFLLENVKMKQEHEQVINDILGVKPIEFNSSLVSAQNRKRLYWTNIEGFIFPTDRGIYWDSIQLNLATNVMYYSEAAFKWIFKSDKRKLKYTEYFNFSKVKMQMLEASHSKGYSNQRCFGIVDNNKTRYIHPIECERLQTLPDNYTEGVSNTQRYKMLGNGWTIDAIVEFFKHLK